MQQNLFTIQDELLVDDADLDRFLETAPTRRAWPAGSAAVIDEMVRTIVQEYDPLAIILFGSRARGTHSPTSDIDLLVVLPVLEDRVQTTLSIGRCLFDAPLPKDVFATTPAQIAAELQIPSSVVRSAIHEGVLLYELGSHLEWASSKNITNHGLKKTTESEDLLVAPHLTYKEVASWIGPLSSRA